ncbi:MAG: SPW repeat protein [Actinomycetota bacterium]|nr:SPW repeat protein [Actinomycetota bacterium]
MGLRMIPTSVHGAIDYLTGGMLLAAPRLLGLTDEPRAALVLRSAGGGALAYSLITDYELGLLRLLPMPAHLAMDAASGVLVAVSPWLLGFAGKGPRYWLPHVLVGATEVLAATTTKTEPSAG